MLAGTELATSAIGYGCGGLMARMGRAESVRCLEVAFDAGITHFDVARSYGYGEAEAAVGEFLRGRRDRVTVTTKLGIAPPRPSAALTAAKAVGRRVLAIAPPLRGLARERAAKLASRGHFGVAEARESLDTSLRELATDHVDLLLLHECAPEDLAGDDLLEFLHGAVAAGKVRHFGVATDQESTRRILDQAPDYAPVVQLCNSLLQPAADAIGEAPGVGVVSHSVLRDGLSAMLGRAAGAPERAAAWSDAIGADCSDPATVAGLLLARASWAGRDGAIALFSSRTEANIRADAAAADAVTADQARRFAELVEREIRPLAAAP